MEWRGRGGGRTRKKSFLRLHYQVWAAEQGGDQVPLTTPSLGCAEPIPMPIPHLCLGTSALHHPPMLPMSLLQEIFCGILTVPLPSGHCWHRGWGFCSPPGWGGTQGGTETYTHTLLIRTSKLWVSTPTIFSLQESADAHSPPHPWWCWRAWGGVLPPRPRCCRAERL